MSWLRFLRRGYWDAERAREIEAHLAIEIDENRARGMTPDEARAAAKRKLGNVTAVREQIYEMNTIRFLETCRQDLRDGFRALRRAPGFTVVASLTLALGIGANTAIFSAVHALLLKELPFPHAERLVFLWGRQPSRGIPELPASIHDYLDWRRELRSFASIAGYWTTEFAVAGGAEPRRVRAVRAFSSYFDVLGIQPIAGRTFTQSEQQWGNHRVVVIGEPLWKSLFAGDRAIVGRTIMMDAEPYTVVGILPSAMSALNPRVQLWVPASRPPGDTLRRVDRFMQVIGRLGPGVSSAEATAEFATLMSRLGAEHDEDKGIEPYLVPVRSQITEPRTRAALLALFGTVIALLLIACINIANLLSARAAARQREMAVRAALGATRRRLIRQLLTEQLLLMVIGGAAGVLVAMWGVDVLRTAAARQIPRAVNIRVDAVVLAFAGALTIVTGLLFGMVPALQASRSDLHQIIKATGRGRRSTIFGPRSLLVTIETALAAALLVCAGLLVNTFYRLTAVDAGFSADRVIVAAVDLPPVHYPTAQKRLAFFHDLLPRVSAIPGVAAAGLTETLPLFPGGQTWTGFVRHDRPLASWENVPDVAFAHVTSGYFQSLRIPLVSGRLFTDDDHVGSPPVAVINEELNRRFFPGEQPIGMRIGLGAATTEWFTIVGVVGDVVLGGLDRARPPSVYIPFAQARHGGVSGYAIVTARTGADPTSFAADLRREMRKTDPNLAIAELHTMREVVAESLDQPRLVAWLVSLFGALAVLLAAVGTYGVLSYNVARRTHEIGIRIALGARRGQLLAMVVAGGLGNALVGVGAGVLIAAACAQALRTLLFGVRPLDALTYASASAILIAIAAFASFLPAARAARLDPTTALRHD